MVEYGPALVPVGAPLTLAASSTARLVASFLASRNPRTLAAYRRAVLGQGRTERTKLTLPEPTKPALVNWLRVQGRRRERYACPSTGRRNGLVDSQVGAWPSSWRKLESELGWGNPLPRASPIQRITEALSLTRGDVRAVQRFSRHRDSGSLAVYADNRENLWAQWPDAATARPTTSSRCSLATRYVIAVIA